jgi:NarL family two-component system response regulator LiaR
MSDEVIRILLVDDHNVVRFGLKTLLRALSGIQLVGEASDGEEAVRLCAQLTPDVVLMDILMPIMDGIKATQIIRQHNPTIQIVALTSSSDEGVVQAMLQAGAIGYLLKNTTFDEVERAIRSAYRGKRVLTEEVTEILVQARTNPQAVPVDLTEREREVLALMVKGLNNPDIAEMIGVSVSTVKFHVSSILSKLYASSRTEAVAIAIQRKLID